MLSRVLSDSGEVSLMSATQWFSGSPTKLITFPFVIEPVPIKVPQQNAIYVRSVPSRGL
jgi:hypothetical protein